MRISSLYQPLLTLTLVTVLGLSGPSRAQSVDLQWEYLVVSYGTTYFSNPLIDADAANATFSKVQLFSEIGVTMPNEAIELQRDIDILGRFGWELVTVVGSIGGDQQLVFKRLYDEQRSQQEAERIRAEREELIAAYNSGKSDAGSSPEGPNLIDLDAVEGAQATADRNGRDEATVRSFIEAAAAIGFQLPKLSVEGRAYSPESRPDVNVQITQDVTSAALVAPGQYRKSLVDAAVEQFRVALLGEGFVIPRFGGSFCLSEEFPGEANIRISAVINQDGELTEVGTYHTVYCFNN